MFQITSKDWLVNQKILPDIESREYEDFWNYQKDLCINGCYIDGLFIPPELYWHLNMWKTMVDYTVEIAGKVVVRDELRNPTLRDNEFIIFSAIDKAQREHKGLAIGGSRRLSKSTAMASYLGYGATLDENSQNVLVGTNSDDMKTMVNMLDVGLNSLPAAFTWMRVEDNWRQQVTLGIKKKDGTRIPFSRIILRNVDGGNNEEAIAGTKPRRLVVDEALEENEHLYTENGKTIKIKDCEVGQKIYGGDGKLTTIIDKISVGVKDIYEFTLADGRKIKSCDDHIWKVSNKRGNFKLLTTFQIRTKITKTNPFYIPYCEPIQGEDKTFIVPPYVLGYHLGDGDSKTGRFCSVHEEPIYEYRKNYDITDLGDNLHYNAKKLVTQLREIGVFDNKHIPKDYLHASERQRREILAGLLDSDGGVIANKNGSTRIIFTNKNKDLADGVLYLSRTLGYGASIRENKNYSYDKITKEKLERGVVYRVEIYTKDPLFKIESKNNKLCQHTERFSDRTKCSIIDVKYVGKSQAYCIKVDNESKLFLTTDCIVTHNCAKNPFLDAYQAAVPGFTTSEGILACSPIMSFTGGNAEKFLDAKKLMFDVEAFNFLAWPDEDNPKRTHGLFLGNKYRQDAKVDSTLGDYIKNKVDYKLHNIDLDIKDDSELFKIPIKVADEEKANSILEESLEKLRKSNDKKKYQKEKMYFPKKVDDIFLNTNINMFNVDAARSQQNKIKFDNIKGFCVELYQDADGTIKTKPSNKEVITEWPLKNQNPDAPIVIYEHPIPNAPKFLYCIGIDPYRFSGQAGYSDSLGSVYVFKRIHSITGEGFQDMIVASYTARPDNKDYWNEQARLLIKYYNGYALCENDELGFIEYMKSKNEAEIYLAPQPSFQKSLVNNSKLTRDFGVSRTATKVRNFMHGLLKNYMDETVSKQNLEDGSVKETVGVSRIFDYALLEEIIGFSEDANTDRLVALECALALANELDPMIGKVQNQEQDSRYKSYFSKDKQRTNNLFKPTQGLFPKRKPNLFK